MAIDERFRDSLARSWGLIGSLSTSITPSGHLAPSASPVFAYGSLVLSERTFGVAGGGVARGGGGLPAIAATSHGWLTMATGRG